MTRLTTLLATAAPLATACDSSSAPIFGPVGAPTVTATLASNTIYTATISTGALSLEGRALVTAKS